MVRHYHNSVCLNLLSPFLFLLVVLGIFSTVWLRSEIISTEYAIGEMESRMNRALEEKQDMEARISSSMSIGEVSQRGMDLDFPDRQRVFYVVRSDSGPGMNASLKEGGARSFAER